jgi:hypothetical protein
MPNIGGAENGACFAYPQRGFICQSVASYAPEGDRDHFQSGIMDCELPDGRGYEFSLKGSSDTSTFITNDNRARLTIYENTDGAY